MGQQGSGGVGFPIARIVVAFAHAAPCPSTTVLVGSGGRTVERPHFTLWRRDGAAPLVTGDRPGRSTRAVR